VHRLEPSSEELWAEAQALVNLNQGVLVIDDSTLDKLYAKKMELVSWHWSGKHHQVIKGINNDYVALWTEEIGTSH